MLQSYIELARKYLRLISNAKRLVLIGVATICLVGWLAVLALPDMFRSEAKLYVDPRSMLDHLLEGIAIDSTNMEQDLLEIARVRLLANENIRRIATENDLLLDAHSDDEIQERLDEVASRVHVRSRNTQKFRGMAQEITLAYEHADPDRAKAIVTSLLNSFIESVLGGNKEDSQRSVEFIDSQIATYEAQLDQAEEALKRFQTENFELMPEKGSSFFDEIQRISADINELNLKVKEATLIRQRLDQQYRELISGSSKTTSAQIAPRIAALESKLDELLLAYTERHPDVVSTREQLDRLLETQSKAPSVGGGTASGVEALVTELGLEISRKDGEVASHQTRLEDYTRRRTMLKEKVVAIPEIEAKLRKLTRDYDVYKEQYEALLQRRESARISQSAEFSDSKVQFQIIEPPYALPRPVAPNRLLLVTMVFLMGWGTMIGFVILKDLIARTIYSASELSKVANIPVLGSISAALPSGALLQSNSVTALFIPISVSVICYLGVSAYVTFFWGTLG